ncbi:MAG: cob(I)yrinic acid a,c-diamide adenosyltransferase [Limisphaerales bacterium]
MSITTKTGDDGTTGLMYRRRVPKCHPRTEACGTVDELNAALGLARATAPPDGPAELLSRIQRDLVALMGELATATEDAARYAAEGRPLVTPAATARLEQASRALEAACVSPGDWVMPGAGLHSAALDLARTVCRRAERRVCSLQQAGELPNPEIIVYLNRLSDLLWLLARSAEPKTR